LISHTQHNWTLLFKWQLENRFSAQLALFRYDLSLR